MLGSARFALVTGSVVVALAAPALADEQPPKGKAERGRLEGTWEHALPGEPGHRQVKVINLTHFVWVTYVRDGGQPLLVRGGTYTFDGKTCKEKYEFGGPGLP